MTYVQFDRRTKWSRIKWTSCIMIDYGLFRMIYKQSKLIYSSVHIDRVYHFIRKFFIPLYVGHFWRTPKTRCCVSKGLFTILCNLHSFVCFPKVGYIDICILDMWIFIDIHWYLSCVSSRVSMNKFLSFVVYIVGYPILDWIFIVDTLVVYPWLYPSSGWSRPKIN